MVYSEGMEPGTLLLLLGVPLLLKGRRSGPKPGETYKPGGEGQALLFEEAIRVANASPNHDGKTFKIPLWWARDPDLVWLLNRESKGRVGIPNFQLASWLYPNLSKSEAQKKMKATPSDWPKVWNLFRQHSDKKSKEIINQVIDIPGVKSTAVGLGQATLPVVRSNYPSKEAGIGDALEEAVGMVRYISRVYRSPSRARYCYEPGLCWTYERWDANKTSPSNPDDKLKMWRGY